MYVHAYFAVFVESNPFVGEELALDVRASESISCTYGAVDKDHSMTGNYIRFGISVQRITDDPGIPRPSSHCSNLAVRSYLSVRDVLDYFVDILCKSHGI